MGLGMLSVHSRLGLMVAGQHSSVCSGHDPEASVCIMRVEIIWATNRARLEMSCNLTSGDHFVHNGLQRDAFFADQP